MSDNEIHAALVVIRAERDRLTRERERLMRERDALLDERRLEALRDISLSRDVVDLRGAILDRWESERLNGR
jgi:hypothetical protein